MIPAGTLTPWPVRALIDDEGLDVEYAGYLATLEEYRRALDHAEGLVTETWGPRLPGLAGGVGLRSNNVDLADRLAPSFAGDVIRNDSGDVVATVYARPHPLALTDDEIATAIATAVDERPGDHSSWFGRFDFGFGDPGRSTVLRVSAAVRVAHAFHWPNLDISGPLSMQMLTYDPGDEFAWHTDANPVDGLDTVTLSAVAQLSPPDAYAGGRLELEHGPVQRTAGTVVVFPADQLHRVTPLRSGRRQSITAFFRSPESGTELLGC